jgi:hypothetical protein
VSPSFVCQEVTSCLISKESCPPDGTFCLMEQQHCIRPILTNATPSLNDDNGGGFQGCLGVTANLGDHLNFQRNMYRSPRSSQPMCNGICWWNFRRLIYTV